MDPNLRGEMKMQTNFIKGKQNKFCDTFVGSWIIMKISSKDLTGVSQYNNTHLAYICGHM